MRIESKIFRYGKRHIQVTVYIYKTQRPIRRRSGNDRCLALCLVNDEGDCAILITEKGLKDGTAIHEATHVVHFSKAKNHELQAELMEDVTVWLLSLAEKSS